MARRPSGEDVDEAGADGLSFLQLGRERGRACCAMLTRPARQGDTTGPYRHRVEVIEVPSASCSTSRVIFGLPYSLSTPLQRNHCRFWSHNVIVLPYIYTVGPEYSVFNYCQTTCGELASM
jgi:hypothetical protein